MSVKFIDFQLLKQNVKIEDLVPRVGLTLKQQGGQWRGPCPVCKSGGDRALVVTPAKGAFYCFAAQQGGDVIALVSHLKGVGPREAAEFIVENCSPASQPAAPVRKATVLSTVPEKEKAGLNPLTYLQPDHPALAELGISPETAQAFAAGYAAKGILRGRLAIPLHDGDGKLLAYCGRTVKNESPLLTFPNGFEPASIIFNASRVTGGELTLVRDPLQVLTAFESGIDNVVAFLTESISPQQLEMLAALMDEKHCDSVELF